MSEILPPITREELKEIIGEDPVGMMDEFKRNIDYFEENRDGLLAKYPYRFVVIQEGVVGAGKDLERLVKRLRKKGVKLTTAYVRYLDPNPPIMILCHAAV